MSRLNLSCPEAARVLSLQQEEPLPLLVRIGLRLHLITCRHCARYGRQIRLLHSYFQDYPHHLPVERLPEERVGQIIDALRRQP